MSVATASTTVSTTTSTAASTTTLTTPAVPPPRVPGPHSRLRIAIVSPDILARIHKEFATKGLTVQIERLPALELTIRPGPGATPAAAALADALSSLLGPSGHSRPAASAHYQLSLLRDGRPAAAAPRPACPLSPREAEVMACIARGMPNADIAALMELSQKTVKNHVNHIFAKLGVRSRVAAVLIWQSREAFCHPSQSSSITTAAH